MERMSLRQLEIWHDEAVKRNARRDLRMLDVIVAPHVEGNDYYRELRSRLVEIADGGFEGQTPASETRTPEEWEAHNRSQFALLRALTQVTVPATPDDQSANISDEGKGDE